MSTLRLAFASSAVLELVATLSVALVAVLVGVRLAEGRLGLGTALVVLLLAPEAYWPLRRVGAEFHAAAEGVATFEAANRLLEQAEDNPASTAPPVQVPWTGVEVDDLVVRYPGRAVPALDLTGRSLHLPAHGLVALTGPSGSGKSTLLAVLAGELPTEQGRVVAAGRRLDEPTSDGWRASVSWVPQRPWLLAGSVRENLLLGRPDADDQELWAALGTVALRDVVAGLPRGLDADVGEDGGRFSAGQRARLALARAVLAGRPLVLVDEPTAHLDPASARGVVAALRRLAEDATVLVVTHDAESGRAGRPRGAARRARADPIPGPARPAPGSRGRGRVPDRVRDAVPD